MAAHEAIAHGQACYRDQSALRFGVELAATSCLIGTVNLYDFFPAHRRCETGYALGSAHWGKGYAVEALAGAFDFAFHTLGLNRIEADIDPRNAASIALMERMGFRKEGFMPERWFAHGETADTVYYGLLRRYRDARDNAAPAI